MRSFAIAALAVMFTACEGREPEADVEPVPEPVVTPGAPAPVVPPPLGGGATGAGEQVNLTPVGNSGVNGEATLTPQGGNTQVIVRLTGLQPNTGHAGHIHRGTCSSLGEVVAPLQEITADANGTGTMTTTVSVPSDSILRGQHLIAYHQDPGTNHGPTIVCGEISRRTM